MKNKKVPTYIIEGGIGKHIMFTSMIPQLVKKSPLERINICSAYSYVFENIDTSLIGVLFSLDDLYSDIFNQYTSDVIFFEPYKSNFGLDKKSHLLKYWCEGYGIDYNEDISPMSINVNDESILNAVDEIASTHKDFIIVQFSGGQSPIGFSSENQYQNNFIQYQRNYPYMFANLLVSKIKNKYPNLTIIDYSLPNEHQGYTDAIRVDLPTIGYAELIKHAKTIIGIDSSLLHMAAANNIKGIGLWGGIPSWQFGWNIHKNITNFKGNIDDFNAMDPYYISIDSDIILKELEEFMQ